MISRRSVLETFAVALVCGTVSPVLAVDRRTEAVRMLDTDNDGTVDLAEAKNGSFDAEAFVL